MTRIPVILELLTSMRERAVLSIKLDEQSRFQGILRVLALLQAFAFFGELREPGVAA